MKGHENACDQVLALLRKDHALKEHDLGSDAHLSKSGMAFDTRAWDIEGVGHLCTMQMKAFLGLMRMETVIIAPTSVDQPLFNLDWVRAAGTETLITEFYDTQLSPWPDECQEQMAGLASQDSDLPALEASEHWYDALLYPCSYHKKGRGLTKRFSATEVAFLSTYVAQLGDAAACDPSAKAEKVRAFAERLAAEGGSAVAMMTKLFGAETAQRIVVQHMYGAR